MDAAYIIQLEMLAATIQYRWLGATQPIIILDTKCYHPSYRNVWLQLFKEKCLAASYHILLVDTNCVIQREMLSWNLNWPLSLYKQPHSNGLLSS